MWNPLAHSRDRRLVTMRLDAPFDGALVDPDGTAVPVLVEHDGHTISWLARDVGRRWGGGPPVRPGRRGPADGTAAGQRDRQRYYRLRVDAARGGGVSSLVDRRTERADRRRRVGNELAVYEEYSAHPKAGRGPGTCCPRARSTTSSSTTAATSVQCYRSPLGERDRRHRPASAKPVDATPRPSRCGTASTGSTPAPRSTVHRGGPAGCGCAGRARCPARCRSARWATR